MSRNATTGRFVKGNPHVSFVARLGKPDANRCWPWLGQVSPNGYGYLSVNRKPYLAHRFSYEFFRDAIPAGMQLDHTCRNRACVNPDHLEPVTARENLLRSPITQASINAAKTHCPRGHELAGENLRIVRGQRRCRECLNTNSRESKRRKRQEQSA